MGIDRHYGSARSVRNEADPVIGNRIGSVVADCCEQLLQVDRVLAGGEVPDRVERRPYLIEYESIAARTAIQGVSAETIHDPVVAAAALNDVAEIVGNDDVIAVTRPCKFDDGITRDLQRTAGD